jgi:uncharacterized protein YegJ (DUF2314 family)
MAEDPKNIRAVCNTCTEKIKAETQKELSLVDLAGKYVKKRFVDGDKAEHMWVRVSSVNEDAGTLVGTLDNEPVVVGNVSLHDEVVVYRDEVEMVMG